MAREQRRLAAILFADAVGSSRLMGRDESGTVARLLKHLNQRLGPAVTRRHGRVIRLKGDGCLVEFASAVDALRAAIEFQQAMIEANRDQPEDKTIEFRVGIHLGDVIVEDDDIYGDDVNVAARLEPEAPPGGILVSRAVREAVQGRLKATLHPLGDLALKNITRPIRAFRVEWSARDWPAADEAPGPPFGAPSGSASAWPARVDKGSIAVLPFKNLTGDPEHEYFVDGLVEDITTALSRISWLFVIPCGSSFAYKGSAVDAREVGRELGVRYVLVGSIRRASNRLRISGEVIDVVTGGHIWADRFEGALEDVFDLQDNITSSVIPAIVPQVLHVEIARAQAKPTTSLTAYDLYLRALTLMFDQKAEAFRQALSFLHKAIEIDPKFSSAHALIADCYLNLVLHIGPVVGNERALGMEAARRAIETGHDNPDALARAGMCIAVLGGRQLEGLQHVERALALNPKTLAILRFAALVYNLVGDHAKALALYERSLHFGVLDKDAWGSYLGLALVHFFARRFGEAVQWADKAFAARPEQGVVCFAKIAAMAAADKPANEIQEFIREWLGTRSPPPVSIVRERMSAFRPIDVKLFAEALRKAGLPE
ncbi:MAG: adenylate/guanylate cyclase domain-containing protein [Rhodospirillales bacterium]|nr:adenylate/guanylate cyclase domain-containing protein [Rhodospirillales bacterium]